jgi:hypothetical protein
LAQLIVSAISCDFAVITVTAISKRVVWQASSCGIAVVSENETRDFRD